MLKIKETKPQIGFIGSDRESILEDLNFAAKNGFDYYEIQAIKEPIILKDFNLKPEIIKQVKRIVKNNNIYLNLHMSRLPSLCGLNPENSRIFLKFAKKEISLANKIGAKRITIHSGNKDEPKNKTMIVKNFNVLIKNLKEIVKLGRKYKIKIGLENLFYPLRLCRTPRDLLIIVNSVFKSNAKN